MMHNYIKIAIRNNQKQKLYFLLNFIGLVIGLACFLTIMFFVQHELSYENFHKNTSHIYRLLNRDKTNGEVSALDRTQLAELLRNEIPEALTVVRFTNAWEETISLKGGYFKEKKFAFADSNFFKMFNFEFLYGNPANALNDPKSIVISSSIAKKYFGKEDVLGEVIYINNKYPLKITGVLKEFPSNTDMDFNFMTNITCMRKIVGNWIDQPWASVLKTYILFANKIDNTEFEQKISYMVKNHFEEWYVSGFEHKLQNIRKQHLYSSNVKFDFEYSGDISNIYMFSFIAIFILIIACINYINISTSKATMRFKEIGIRRVMGATSKQIVLQFLCESLFISIMALVCSISLVNLLFHYIKFLPIKETANISLIDWRTILSLSILLLFITLLSGGIIATYMARVDSSKALSGSIKLNFKNPIFRHLLVTFQFLVAITLMICVNIIYRQYSFMRDKELGFDKQSLITLDFPSNYNEYKVFKNSILNDKNISQVTASDMVPPNFGIGNIVPLDLSDRKDLPIVLYHTDHDFINTLGLKIIHGRNISDSFTTDEKEAIVINEAAAKELGWSDPIGKRLKINEGGKEYCKVVGVIKDFHYSSLCEKIAPLAITVYKNTLSHIIIKVRANDIKSTLKYVKGKWKEIFPLLPFSYSFVQDDFAKRYEKEEKLYHLYSFFSMIAVIIACLGLFGLSSYSTECRKKEIGIRKVVGASVSQIVILISKEFFFIVIIANIMAWPIAYYFMQIWLQRFAYKIELDLWLFLAPGLIILLLSGMTVGYHSIKAAINNPTMSIKCE